jgi:hypothetical protein
MRQRWQINFAGIVRHHGLTESLAQSQAMDTPVIAQRPLRMPGPSDIRVGMIEKVESVAGSEKLVKLTTAAPAAESCWQAFAPNELIRRRNSNAARRFSPSRPLP